MKRKYFYLTAIIAVLSFAALGLMINPFSQQASAKVAKKTNDKPPSDTLVAKMRKAEENLRGIESSLAKIEESKVITAEDNEALDKNGFGLGETLNEAFQEASKSAQQAAETEGREGNVNDLVYFESFEQDHVRRTEQIVVKSEKIQRGIEDGSITLKDRQESGLMMAKANYTSDKNDNSCETSSVNGSKVLKPCVAPCIAQNWAACASCILRNVPAGIQQYNQFANCWNNCRGFWKWFCRAKCLANFVYWIY
jgi:lipopolysaccharide export LptBFGC system permease protein LptF